MSNKIGRISAFVMGLIAGIIHGIFGILAALAIFLAGGFMGGFFGSFFYGLGSITIVIGIVIFFIALFNLIGGCIVRSSRIAGGVFMLLTSLPIIIFSLFSYAMIFITITGLLSLTAAILAFIPYSDRYKQLYISRKQKTTPGQQQYYQQQQYQQQQYAPQQPQPYAPQQPQQPYAPQQPYTPQQPQPYAAPQPSTAPPVAPTPVALEPIDADPAEKKPE